MTCTLKTTKLAHQKTSRIPHAWAAHTHTHTHTHTEREMHTDGHRTRTHCVVYGTGNSCSYSYKLTLRGTSANTVWCAAWCLAPHTPPHTPAAGQEGARSSPTDNTDGTTTRQHRWHYSPSTDTPFMKCSGNSF